MQVSILGTRVIRTEDPRFLTTGGVYTDDLRLPGACHVHFARSAVAHARILSVDVSAAREAPGVIAAFTGADLANLPTVPPPIPGMLNEHMRQPLLAQDVVRYVGEPVAVIVTEGRYQGEDAADLVDVDYEVLPPVVEAAEADAADAAVLFPAAGTNVAATFGDAAALAADLFEGCEVVISRTIVNQRVAPAPMETRAAAAAWGADGRLTAWIPNQGAQGTRAALAGMLGMDQAEIRVITPDVGGAFGAKFGADPEHAVVCWVARRLGRPALGRDPLREPDRHDPRQGAAQTVSIGGSRDGEVAAYRLEILQDSGAYPRFGAFLPFLTILMAPGPYAIARAEAVAKSVVTSTTPVGAFRGAAGPRPRPPSSGPSTCSPPRSARIRPRCAGRTCCPSSPSRTRPPSVPCTTAATTRSRWTGRWRRPDTATCGPSRPSDARTGTWCSSASACPAMSR